MQVNKSNTSKHVGDEHREPHNRWPITLGFLLFHFVHAGYMHSFYKKKRIEKPYSRRLPNCRRAHTPNPKERGPRATTRVEKIAYPDFGRIASLLDFKCLL